MKEYMKEYTKEYTKECEEESVVARELRKHGYFIEDTLGNGTTAIVLQVADRKTGKQFACKIGTRRDWLLPEADLLERLQHPIFPEFFECWEDDGMVFLVMEYLEGKDLQAFLDAGRTFTEEDCIRIALELADGLGYLHDLNPQVIYRDLKPENILMDGQGRIHLVDLGAAAAPNGWIIGTPGYAAPELRDSCPGPTADIYALGIVMRRMSEGEKLSRAWRKLLATCTSIQSGDRIPGMHELRMELSQLTSQKRYFPSMFVWGKRKQVFYKKNIWLSGHKMQV